MRRFDSGIGLKLKVETVDGFSTHVEGVFDFFHLGNQIGSSEKSIITSSSAQDEMGRAPFLD